MTTLSHPCLIVKKSWLSEGIICSGTNKRANQRAPFDPKLSQGIEFKVCVDEEL